MNSRRSYDQAEAEAARKATLEGLHQQIADGLSGLAGQWDAYLRFARGFTRYSVNNQLLLWAQKPDATLVAGYRTWQANGRQVRRGEKALKVLGPVTRRQPALDAAGNPQHNPDGSLRLETRIVGVKPVSVFDLSQTDGDPLPVAPTPTLLSGQAPAGLWDSLQAFIEAEGYQVHRRDCGTANGITDFTGRQVWVRADVDDAMACRTLAHEAGHVLLHADMADRACRGIREVEAESVAYLVTASQGLDAAQYTFHYVTGWALEAITDQRDLAEVLRSTAERVIGAADTILEATQLSASPIDGVVDALGVDVDRTITRHKSIAASPETVPAITRPTRVMPAAAGPQQPAPAPAW